MSAVVFMAVLVILFSCVAVPAIFLLLHKLGFFYPTIAREHKQVAEPNLKFIRTGDLRVSSEAALDLLTEIKILKFQAKVFSTSAVRSRVFEISTDFPETEGFEDIQEPVSIRVLNSRPTVRDFKTSSYKFA